MSKDIKKNIQGSKGQIKENYFVQYLMVCVANSSLELQSQYRDQLCRQPYYITDWDKEHRMYITMHLKNIYFYFQKKKI